MPTISDYLQSNVAGVVNVTVNKWVRMVNNSTSTAYVSTAASDINGLYTINNLPAGTYTVYTGGSSTGPWNATGDANYDVGDDPTLVVHLAGAETITGNKTFSGDAYFKSGDPFYSARGLGIKFDGTTDDTTNWANAIAGLPASGGYIVCPAATTITGPIALPAYPKVVNIIGAGIGLTVFQSNAINSKLFDTSSTASSANKMSGFSVKAHASGSTGMAIDLFTARGTRWEDIGYLSNGTGNYSVMFSMGGSLCYGNEIVRPWIQQQSGPTTIVKFTNAGTNATNANVNYIRNGWFYANTGITTAIDALRSAQTVIENTEFEQNTGMTCIIPGTTCLIKSNWFEGNAASIAPQAVAGQGTSNNVTLLNNYFSTVETLTLPTTVGNWHFIGNLVNLTVVDNTQTSLQQVGNVFSSHLVFKGGNGAPTLGALQAGISTQTLNRGNDTAGVITLVTTAAPPTAGAALCVVTFQQAYQAAPVVLVVTNNGNGSATDVVSPFFVSATGFTIYARANLAAATSYTIGYLVMGT